MICFWFEIEGASGGGGGGGLKRLGAIIFNYEKCWFFDKYAWNLRAKTLDANSSTAFVLLQV